MHEQPDEPTKSPQTVSYTQLTSYRKCPQFWWLRYRERIQPIESAAPPAWKWVGIWVHAVLAAKNITQGRKQGKIVYVPPTISTPDGWDDIPTDDTEPLTVFVIQHMANWWAKLPIQVKEMVLETTSSDIPSLVIDIIRRYNARVGTKELNEKRTILAVELPWSRTIPPTEPGGTPVEIRGFIDAVYYDSDRGYYTIADYKTAKDIGKTALDDLLDAQLHLYAWGASTKLEELGIPRIDAVSYVRVRSTKAKTPQLTKAGKLGRTVTDYDDLTYIAWANSEPAYEGTKKDGPGVYKLEPAVLEKLQTPDAVAKWVHTTLRPINLNTITSHVYGAMDTASMIRSTELLAQQRGEAPRNLTSACKWCEMSPLCQAQVVGGPHGDYQLEPMGLEKKL